jgi:hypothetical protein
MTTTTSSTPAAEPAEHGVSHLVAAVGDPKPAPVYAVYSSGVVRHIGPAERAYLAAAGVREIPETDSGARGRLSDQARVRQGHLKP